ncbi:MAG TPA: hypothetical protein PLG57_01655 [Bacteroidia bacterium]|nr:hypothetical protein [Bacteroidia bacterium]HQF27848.1 hypothetical protein [Bacteroidia bacterium]HQK97820.1 hypothetical protein [Bacteroidia bacterium]
MVTAEIIIKKQADDFKDNIEQGMRRDSHLEFKSKLESVLYNYDENIDKLIFLYQTLKHIDTYFENHQKQCEYMENPEKCNKSMHFLQCKFFTEQEIKRLNPSYEYSILRPNINSNLIKQNLIELKKFPDVARLYQNALDKLNEERFERNLLDDLRLMLETLLKEILQNSKSLEKQIEDLGKYLQSKNVSLEVRNMFVTLNNYFAKYQNEYVKHKNSVNKLEIEFIFNLTSTFASFLLNI